MTKSGTFAHFHTIGEKQFNITSWKYSPIKETFIYDF